MRSLTATLVALTILILAHHADGQQKREWYEAGNLHRKTIADWKKAKYENKLATCGDFIAAPWESKEFVPSVQDKIKRIDDMKPYAEKLVAEINKVQNEKKLEGRKVTETAAASMILLKWLK